MNLQFYYEKLIGSKECKDFLKENKDVYLCSGLFIIDKSVNKTEVNFDYFSPLKKEIFSFKLDGDEIKIVPMKHFGEKVPEKLSGNFDIDMDFFEKLVLDKMEEEKINNQIQKLFFNLQSLEEKNYFVLTGFLSNMALLKAHIDINKKEFEFFKKQSILGMMNVFKKN